MRLAYVANTSPIPRLSGSAVRIFYLLKYLSREMDVDLYYVDEFGRAAEVHPELARYAGRIRTVPRANAGKAACFLKSLLVGRPSLAVEFFDRRLFDLLREDHVRRPFDAIMVSHPPLAEYLFRGWPGVLTVVSFDDFNSHLYRRRARHTGSVFRRLLYLFEARRMRRWEQRICEEVGLIAPVSRKDLTELSELTRGRPHLALARNGVDIDAIRFDKKEKIDETISLIGNFDYYPNVDALEYFVREILPLILRQRPATRVLVNGVASGRKIHELCAAPCIELETDPAKCADPADVVRRSSVMAVPLRMGGGTRIKIPYSFALGCPVVSTAIGAEGLDAQAGEDYLLADTPEDFANAVVNLFADYELHARIAAHARRTAEARYDWRQIATDLATAIRTVAGAG